ncbi:MAG: DUF2179 domain-containing protein [Phycisphaerales bacterium]|nr:DUF2179 domain-containing protein [Phycisphaerales bacterium]
MCLVIVTARIADVSLGTIRTIMVVQGRRGLAFVLGFFEILIWVSIVSSVIQQLGQQPLYAVAYAVGFALGNYVGMTIEQRLALGQQVVRVISRDGAQLAATLRSHGYRVTQFDGFGRDGPVQELFVQVHRRDTARVIAEVRSQDPKCYFTVDDVRLASTSALATHQQGGWRGMMKRK